MGLAIQNANMYRSTTMDGIEFKIISALLTGYGVLASAVAFMYKERVAEAKAHLTYERSQKEKSNEFASELASESLITMNELIVTVKGIGGVVSNEGGKTRSRVEIEAGRVITHINSK